MALPKPDPNGTCVITGASSGIGAEMARILADRGYGLTLVARREDRLAELAGELTAKTNGQVITVVADVTDPAGRDEIFRSLKENDKNLQAFVNNAGFSCAGDFLDVTEEDVMAIIDTNVIALASLMRRALPLMVARGEGAVLNVASTAAFQPIPHESTYSASKAFVLNLTDAVGRELKGTGVSCSTLCPGPTDTEFASVAGLQDEIDSLPRILVSDPKNVAAHGVAAMTRGRRVRISGFINKIGAFAGRFSPRASVLAVMDAAWPNPRAKQSA